MYRPTGSSFDDKVSSCGLDFRDNHKALVKYPRFVPFVVILISCPWFNVGRLRRLIGCVGL